MVSWVAVLTVYVHYLVTTVTPVNPGCDCVVYQSYGLNDGRFISPNFPALYPPNTNCILYSFFGDSFEIIELTFFEFELRDPDSSGRCRDYVRIFQNLERPEVNENSQWDVELCGNYSSLKRKKYYSSDRSLILEFHSEGRINNKYRGFRGVYQFLDKRNYTTTGRRINGHPCTYEFTSNSSQKSKTGQFFSPFYPQTYKPNSKCRYKLRALEGERVRVVFSNIQLHHTDGSCLSAPDVLTIYEGWEEGSNVIEQYCGFHNNQEIISSTTELMVVFKSDSRLEEQGFAARYEFFGKIRTNPNIRNTNASEVISNPAISSPARCGSIINSLDQKNGTIESPHYPRPYPSDVTCRFTFQGVGRERVQLRFVHMDLHFPSGDPSNPVDCTDSDSVTVYININGKETKLDTYCGEKLPPMLMSSGHSGGQAMIVEFRSYRGSDTVTGFRAHFNFVTNFGITSGKQDSRGTCVFNYMSHQQTEGHIMSPNYPGLYPRNTECHYLFYGRGKERVHITFLYFEVDGIPPRCEERTDSDYVSFSNFAETEDRKLFRMCGQSAVSKQQIKSDGAFFRVTFKSNHVYDGHGFHAFYQFFGGPTREHIKNRDNSNNPHNPNNHGNHPNDHLSNTGGDPARPSLPLLLSILLLSLLLPPALQNLRHPQSHHRRRHHHHHGRRLSRASGPRVS